MTIRRSFVMLLILIPIWVVPGAETLRVALLAEDDQARNAADLALAGLSGEFEFVERARLDRVIAERKLQAGTVFGEEAMARASALTNAKLFVVISSGVDASKKTLPTALTVFDSESGIRLTRKLLPEDETGRNDAIRNALRCGAERYRNRANCRYLALVAFRNATMTRSLEIAQLEAELSVRLHSLTNVIIVERDYLEHLLRERSLGLVAGKIAESGVLLSVECVPDPDPVNFKTSLALRTIGGATLLRQDFAGAERNRPEPMIKAVAGALKTAIGDSPQPDLEAKVFFNEYRYAYNHGNYPLARKKIYSAIALNPRSVLYRAWAMECWSRVDTAGADQAIAAVNELLEGTTSTYLKEKADQVKNDLAARKKMEKSPPVAPVKAARPKVSGELACRILDKWSEARFFLGAQRYDGKLYLLLGNNRQELLLYGVAEKRILAKIAATGYIHVSNIAFAIADGMALATLAGKLYLFKLDGSNVAKIDELPSGDVMALTAMNGRIYLFAGNGRTEMVLFSCDPDGGGRRLDINPHKLSKSNYFEEQIRMMKVLTMVADPASNRLCFGVFTDSNGGGGYAGFHSFNPSTGDHRMLAPLCHAKTTRPYIGGERIDNAICRDGEMLFWANRASSYQNEKFEKFNLFMTFDLSSGRFEVVAKSAAPAGADVFATSMVLKTPDLFGPFTISGDRLVISDERGVLAVCGKDGETCFNAPAMKALFAVAGTDRVIGVTERSVLEFEIGKSSSIVSERSQK